MEKDMKRPAIQFAGFTDPWEQRKLGDVFNFQYGEGNTNPSDGGDYPVYGAGGQQGTYSKYNAENSIIIGHMGDAGCVSWGEGKHFVTYNGTITTSKSCDFPIRFGYYLLLTCDLRKLTGGSSLKFLTYEMIRDFSAHIPQSKREQILIGTLFCNLDNLITLHQRKCDKLISVKKSMLEKMFPQNGSNIPEIRFAGFTDPWEQRKLGDVADIIGGGTPSTSIIEYWGDEIDWYAPAEIGEQIYLTGSQKKITELGFQNSSAKILPVGSVLFTSRAGIGNTAILTKIAATNQGFQSIVPHKGELNSYFIFSRSHELKRYGETVGAGSTFVEVSGKQMARMPILMPTILEQLKIGELFATIDNLINLHQRKLEKLKNIKKSLLGKMFV